MAINNFIDEQGTNLNKYKFTFTDPNVLLNGQNFFEATILREANITTVGTPLNASKLNSLVSGINSNSNSIQNLQNNVSDLFTELESFPNTYVGITAFDSLASDVEGLESAIQDMQNENQKVIGEFNVNQDGDIEGMQLNFNKNYLIVINSDDSSFRFSCFLSTYVFTNGVSAEIGSSIFGYTQSKTVCFIASIVGSQSGYYPELIDKWRFDVYSIGTTDYDGRDFSKVKVIQL